MQLIVETKLKSKITEQNVFCCNADQDHLLQPQNSFCSEKENSLWVP